MKRAAERGDPLSHPDESVTAGLVTIAFGRTPHGPSGRAEQPA
jgi:hypothetical protein